MFSALYPAHRLGTGAQMYHPGGAVGCGYGPVKPVENCPETYVFQLSSKKKLASVSCFNNRVLNSPGCAGTDGICGAMTRLCIEARIHLPPVSCPAG